MSKMAHSKNITFNLVISCLPVVTSVANSITLTDFNFSKLMPDLALAQNGYGLNVSICIFALMPSCEFSERGPGIPGSPVILICWAVAAGSPFLHSGSNCVRLYLYVYQLLSSSSPIPASDTPRYL